MRKTESQKKKLEWWNILIIVLIIALISLFVFKLYLTNNSRQNGGFDLDYQKLELNYTEPTNPTDIENATFNLPWGLENQQSDLALTIYKSDDVTMTADLMSPAVTKGDYESVLSTDFVSYDSFFKKHMIKTQYDLESYVYQYDSSHISTLSAFYPLPKLLDIYKSTRLQSIFINSLTSCIYAFEIDNYNGHIIKANSDNGKSIYYVYARTTDEKYGLCFSIHGDVTDQEVIDFASSISIKE